MTIKQAIQDYLALRRGEGCSPKTLNAYGNRLKKMLRFFSKKGIANVNAVTPELLDAYAQHLTLQRIGYRSRVSYLSTAKILFDWLSKSGKVLSNPARGVAVPRTDEEPLPEPPLEQDEVIRIIDGIPRRSVADLRNRLHLELLYSCGLRISEYLNLKLGDFDMQTRSVRVKGKGSKVRVLPLMKGVLGAMKDYLALRRSLLKGPDSGILLLGTNSGRAVNPNCFEIWLRGWCKRLGVMRRIHPHLFRHSIAVHLLQRGADIRHVQEFLGHESIDTTKIYLRMVPGRLKEDYDKAMPQIDLASE